MGPASGGYANAAGASSSAGDVLPQVPDFGAKRGVWGNGEGDDETEQSSSKRRSPPKGSWGNEEPPTRRRKSAELKVVHHNSSDIRNTW